jgi:hypothetical protein
MTQVRRVPASAEPALTGELSTATRIQTVVDRLAERLGGAVLVHRSPGEVMHHGVSDSFTPSEQLVRAILRHDLTELVPELWPAAEDTDWTLAFESWGVIARCSVDDVVLTAVLVPASQEHVRDDFQVELDALRSALSDQPGRPLTPPQAALVRLVDGCAAPGDGGALGMPIHGARLVVVPRLQRSASRHVLAALSTDKEAVCAPHPTAGLVVIVRGQPRSAANERALHHAISVAQRAHGLDRNACAGISSPLEAQDQLPLAMADALDALEGHDPGTSGWVVAEDVWARVAVRRLRGALEACLPVSHPLQRLVEYDTQRRGELAVTVGAWLDLNGDTAATAAALSVHPNTLRYRVRRVEEISGLDLSAGDQRLVAQLALGCRRAG